MKVEMILTEGTDKGSHFIGIFNENIGCFVSVCTVLKVSAAELIACRLNHLSISRGSFPNLFSKSANSSLRKGICKCTMHAKYGDLIIDVICLIILLAKELKISASDSAAQLK